MLPSELELIGLQGDAVTIIDGGGVGTTVTIPLGITVTLDGLHIRGGRGSLAGGVYSEGNLTLRNCTVSGNECTGVYGAGGGGVSLVFASAVIDGCVIEGNVGAAGGYGASAIYSYLYGSGVPPTTITGSTISGNTAPGPTGGALFFFNGPLVLRDSTVSGNRGAGVRLATYGSSSSVFEAIIEGSTIVENDATGTTYGLVAGGISRFGLSPTMKIQNTIVAGNIGNGVAPDVNGRFFSRGGNVIGNRDGAVGLTGTTGDQTGTTSAPLSAGLEPLARNGGRTATHRPSGGSVAVDGGVDVPGLTFDQRGVPHPTGARDSGAHERGVGSDLMVCVPSPNSTGGPTLLEASANLDPAQNSMFLTMLDVPRDSFGFCVTSSSVGSPVQPPMSQGFLCLTGAVGRLTGPGQVTSSGAAGRIRVPLDLTQHPTAMGPVTVMSGETWYFQGWHRDLVTGVATSNFSAAVSVTFQ